MSEKGFFIQFGTVGLTAGYDTENGYTFGVYGQLSLGIVAERWETWHLDFGDSIFDFEIVREVVARFRTSG